MEHINYISQELSACKFNNKKKDYISLGTDLHSLFCIMFFAHDDDDNDT